jgi:hypothetical protein
MSALRSVFNSVGAGLACLAFGFVGCHGTGEANSADSPPSTPEAHLKGAIKDIVTARCDREERCNNVGLDKTYASREACTSKLEGNTSSDLNMQDCEHGVDRPKLHECLAKIHGEDCGNPIDALSRVTACRTGALCVGG